VRHHRNVYPTWAPPPYSLSWREADPARHPFDVASAAVAVHAIAPEGDPLADPGGWVEAMSRGVAVEFGPWASGWQWSVGEGELDGGPVGSWCCAHHSVTTRGETLQRIAEALIEWRSYLEDLADQFGRFLPLPVDRAARLDNWERAVAHLVTVTADRTGGESGWYGHCELVLGWFLEAAGVPAEGRSELVEHAIGGRFRSWSTPSSTEITAVAERLAADLAG
jgi:hypothetical protein